MLFFGTLHSNGYIFPFLLYFSLSSVGEGNGNPLQFSSLESPRDGSAWWAAISGAAQSRTWLSGFIFKKIRDTKGMFHAKMGLIKDRNGMNLTEAEDINKRWEEYTEELQRKDISI